MMRSESEPSRLDTRFGAFDLDPRDIVEFPDGLPGYEECRQFVLVTSPTLAPLQCLHSVGDHVASFLVTDPGLVCPEFERTLASADRDRLQATEDTPLLWLSILTVDADGAMHANLRAPVIINAERMVGSQVIPQHSAYPVRGALALAS